MSFSNVEISLYYIITNMDAQGFESVVSEAPDISLSVVGVLYNL